MAARTTEAAVQNILGDHWDGSTDVGQFIDTASALVDWVDSKDSDSELSATMLELIERYLAAHFYEHADQIAQSKSTSGASGSFQGQTAMVLSGTKYGQTAMLLDVTGMLGQRSAEAARGGRQKVTVTWLGKPPSEQVDYVDRD